MALSIYFLFFTEHIQKSTWYLWRMLQSTLSTNTIQLNLDCCWWLLCVSSLLLTCRVIFQQKLGHHFSGVTDALKCWTYIHLAKHEISQSFVAYADFLVSGAISLSTGFSFLIWLWLVFWFHCMATIYTPIASWRTKQENKWSSWSCMYITEKKTNRNSAAQKHKTEIINIYNQKTALFWAMEDYQFT